MGERDGMAQEFVRGTEWAGAALAPLAGDASNRRYLRLAHPVTGQSAVLMDAPPEKGEDIRPFVRIAEHLASIGLSAPGILASDPERGFLLLEDMGDALYARVIPQEPALEEPLYEAAIDVLVTLHAHPAPGGIGTYDPATMADLAALACDWYARGVRGPDTQARTALHGAMLDALKTHAPESSVLIQRDYHAENLLWLPEREGVARVGLLDFQDAMRGHPAYDLVSLLQDARRDVPPEIEKAMVARYVARTGTDTAAFTRAYHVLGAQRNLRIMGVFARLCLRDGKPHYLTLMQRVWAHLMNDLAHPALAELAPLVHAALPAPDAATLTVLRDQCASIR